jgi:hypothetical protein
MPAVLDSVAEASSVRRAATADEILGGLNHPRSGPTRCSREVGRGNKLKMQLKMVRVFPLQIILTLAMAQQGT